MSRKSFRLVWALALAVFMVPSLRAEDAGGQSRRPVIAILDGQEAGPTRSEGNSATRPSLGAVGDLLGPTAASKMRSRKPSTSSSPTKDNRLWNICAEALGAEVVARGRFDVVERSRMAAVMQELKLQNSGLVDEATACKIGGQLGARYVAFGEVLGAEVVKGSATALGQVFDARGIHADVTVAYKVVDVETGRVWLHQILREKESSSYSLGNRESGSNDQGPVITLKALQKTAVRFAESLVPVLDGAVAEVEGQGRAIITLGSAQGFAQGMVVEVYRKGKEIKDPLTGAVLDAKTEVVCYGRCVETRERISTIEVGEVTKGKWRANASKLKGVQTGDLVRTIQLDEK